MNFDNYGGQVGELLSHNGYAYCKNNPVNMVDEDGQFPTLLISTLVIILLAITITTIPQETWTNLAETTTTILTNVSLGITNIATKKETTTNTQTKTQTTTKNKNIEDKVVFPLNPDDFNPKGLTKVVYPGTKNGKIIKWQIEGITKFEWNEDLKYGSHYHITPLGKHTGIGIIHFKPFQEIPEPYRSIYFY